MRRIWVKNIEVTKAHAEATRLENKTGYMHIVRNAQADDINSATDLSVMGMAGIYMEHPSNVPDPNCPDCHGKGEVTLFKFSKPCDCVNKSSEKEDDSWDDAEDWPDYHC